MATVTYRDLTFECAKAYKGGDYIHLVDDSGTMIAAFDGINDFSDFSITDGSWDIPPNDHYCFIAVMREDGTIGKGGHLCSQIPTASETWTFTLKDGTTVTKKVVVK